MDVPVFHVVLSMYFLQVGRHRQPRWTTAIEILDDEHFLAAESESNIYVAARDSPENTQEPKIASLVMAPARTRGVGVEASAGDIFENSSGVSINATTKTPSSVSSETRTLADCAFMHAGDSINTFVKGMHAF